MTWWRDRVELLLFVASTVLLAAGGAAWLAHATEVADAAWIGGTLLGLAFSIAWTVSAVRRRQPSVDVIALLALAGAIWVKEPFAGAMITVMLATGQLLDARASARARRELSLLVERAPRTARRRVAGGVVDVPVEEVALDFYKGEHVSEPYISLNPNGLVPTLDDDGFVLTESSAIMKYLADKYDLPVYPKDLRKRARVNELMDWFNTGFYRDYGYNVVYPQIYPHHKRPDDTTQSGTIAWGKSQTQKWLKVLNDHWLGKGNKFLTGNEMTIADIFDARSWFPLVFACVALGIATANFSNAAIVERFGARRVSQSATFAFLVTSILQILIAVSGAETLWMFTALMMVNVGLIGFIGSNFGSIAMEDFGHMAGVASSYQSFAKTLLAATVGALIGQLYDGTLRPFATGSLVFTLAAIAVVLVTERGHMFTPSKQPH